MKQFSVTAVKNILRSGGLLCLFLWLTFTAMAQSGKVWQRMVKVPANDHSLLQVLSVIEKQTGVTFNYDRTILNVQQPVKGGLQGRLLWMGCLFMNNR